MGWIWCVRWDKFWPDFVAQTFALIAPVQYVLQQVSCSYETIPNAPKHYQTHRNMSLGSNGVDWLRSLRKIPMRFSRYKLVHELYQFNPFCTEFRVLTKYCQIHTNTTRRTQTRVWGSNGVDWVHSLRKILMRLHGTNFCINYTSSTRFALSFV